RRFRLDTVSLRGLYNQQIHGSKRSLRSVEDFTEFEQRTAYFNGDPIRAMKKGDERPGPDSREPYGAAPEHAGLPAGAEARHRGPPDRGRGHGKRAPRTGRLF